MSDRPVVLALHFQNDVLHPRGRIRVGLAEDASERAGVVDAARNMLSAARERAWPIIHVRIAFRDDYADCATHLPIMRKVVELGAVRDGQWGAEFTEGLQPRQGPLEFIVTHTRISAFVGTPLMELLTLLGARRLLVGGVATHSVVEGTVREAADRGYEVCVATDACAAADASVHQAALRSMALVASVTTLADALTSLDGTT